MYPLYTLPENEDGAYGERILPRWIGRERQRGVRGGSEGGQRGVRGGS